MADDGEERVTKPFKFVTGEFAGLSAPEMSWKCRIMLTSISSSSWYVVSLDVLKLACADNGPR